MKDIHCSAQNARLKNNLFKVISNHSWRICDLIFIYTDIITICTLGLIDAKKCALDAYAYFSAVMITLRIDSKQKKGLMLTWNKLICKLKKI